MRVQEECRARERGMNDTVEEINRRARDARERLAPLFAEVEKVVVGQRHLIQSLVVGLLTDGHILLEGVPGLAKTLAVRTVARALQLDFRRIQFTPDLLPADVIGTQIYNPRTGEFSVKKGPVFANLILADEINPRPLKCRAPCWKRCKNAKSPLASEPTNCPSRSSCWQRKTQSSKREHIRCPKLKSIALCSKS